VQELGARYWYFPFILRDLGGEDARSCLLKKLLIQKTDSLKFPSGLYDQVRGNSGSSGDRLLVDPAEECTEWGEPVLTTRALLPHQQGWLRLALDSRRGWGIGCLLKTGVGTVTSAETFSSQLHSCGRCLPSEARPSFMSILIYVLGILAPV
jgi:hypothetical protein